MVRQLIPWNSMSGQLIDVFQREMEDLAGRLQDSDSCTGDSTPMFSPRADVLESDSTFELAMELSGVAKEDFDIEFLDGRLTISGEVKPKTLAEGMTLHRAERRTGKFRRIFALGNDVDSERISAEYENGILTVHVPKVEKVQPKKIQVN